MTSIYKRESFADFLHRIVELQRVHSGEDARLDALESNRDKDEEAIASMAAEPDATVATRKELLTIHTEFPYGAPLNEQAAYLMRAFTGLEPFGGEDHKTGWDYTVGLLEFNGHVVTAKLKEIETMTLTLWDRLQHTYPGGMQRRQVLDRDATFTWLTEWFHRRTA